MLVDLCPDPALVLGVLAQERLIALVAEHLLDRNGEDSMAAGATDDFRANLARNVADAIELLPKLVRGRAPSSSAADAMVLLLFMLASRLSSCCRLSARSSW